MGFPIRKSSDQSSFAAPQGLSQRTTSFIASQRQGIHRMLLRHLITLMIDVRRPFWRRHTQSERPCLRISPKSFACRTHLIESAVTPSLVVETRCSTIRCIPSSRFQTSRTTHRRSRSSMTTDDDAVWWSQTGSNRRPPACKAGALPTELWPQREKAVATIMVGLGRLERPTSPLSGVRSNHLSYRPDPRIKSEDTRRSSPAGTLITHCP